jgi:hypothetical protein
MLFTVTTHNAKTPQLAMQRLSARRLSTLRLSTQQLSTPQLIATKFRCLQLAPCFPTPLNDSIHFFAKRDRLALRSTGRGRQEV